MIRSMTGFGEASAQHAGHHYFVEIRSLNNRYFKATIRLPDELQGLEAELESTLRDRLQRGTVALNLTVRSSSPDAAPRINTALLSGYLRQLREISSGEPGIQIDLAALLGLPGVLETGDDEEERLHEGRRIVAELLARAIDGLDAQRAREGGSIAAILTEQHDAICACLVRLRDRAPDVSREYEQRLATRLRALLDRAELKGEPADVIREVAIFAERTDIAEEIARLEEHMRYFRELLDNGSDELMGRRLDFLSQEMLREANTIASKSPDGELSRTAVEIKAAIDRIKEQVQNVL